MRPAQLPELDLASLRDAVDPGSYRRGERYARQGAVAQLRWESSRSALQGLVRGSGGQFYTTIAYFSPGGAPFEHGVCSCPVGADCKHVVALVLTAMSADDTDRGDRAARAPAEPAGDRRLYLVPAAEAPPPQPEWEASLGALLGGAGNTQASAPAPTPLGIELTYSPGQARPATRWQPASQPVPKLLARLVQPGRSGGWAAGSLSWSKLDSLSYYGSYCAAQIRALRDLYALHKSASQYGYYGYGDEKNIDLLTFESAQLWPLLDEATGAGLRLVHARGLGDVELAEAAVCLDVTSADDQGGLALAPVLRLAPVAGPASDVVPLRFIGSSGHGLAYARPGDGGLRTDPDLRRVGLARLARPVPPPLQRMLLGGQRLEVPATDQVRFASGYYPRLRRWAEVTSSDGSFEPPEISGPALVLQATYQPGHELDLRWAWSYQVGDSTLRLPPGTQGDPGADACRDEAAERRLLAELDLPLESYGLAEAGQRGRDLVPHARLAGLATMRFTTELLPLLAGHLAVAAEVSGDPADYRETSDSLQIGVATAEVAGDTDWFDLGITITVDGREVPFADMFVALSRGESHLLLADGAYFSLLKPELQALAALIGEARALRDAPPGELRISRFQAGLWQELAELGVVSRQAQAWQEQVSGLLTLGSIDQPSQPAGLLAQLRPYQADGFGWLAFLWRHRLGGILADDMGLGKTLQSLALISHARDADQDGPPFLIVAPTSVVPNWAAEAARFAPGLRVVAISETGARRGEKLADVVAGADAVVTSYTLLRIDVEEYCAQRWAGLILDEAQFAKNHQSKIYQCARRLPAPVKVAITGTPMENNLMELWSLLSITAPGLFPSPVRFREYYARPIERSSSAELLGQLRRRIRPLVMRRTKEQVAAELPAKQEQVLEVDLHPRHRKLYQTHLQRERQKVLGLIGDMDANRFAILRSLTLLRQLSLHAGLVDAEHADLASAKLDVLAEQLADVVGGGHKALVFSQFTGFLRMAADRLDAEGIGYCYLDGSTRGRAAVIDRFTSGLAPVFLISLKAGGFGLNLTEADYCFLLDPWWNPATEAQAVDRAHRIGQTRNVMVYRLISRDTIEQKVMALKARKAELFSSVLDEGNVFGASLNADDIRGLFG